MNERNSDIMVSWLKHNLEKNLEKDVRKEELKPILESLRRQNPTKFYLLEQELIKFIRRELKKPIIRKSRIDKDKNGKKDPNKSDDDFEPPSDASDYIYS